MLIFNYYLANPCILSPCLNNGVCLPVDDADIVYQCNCRNGYFGKNCQFSSNPCSSYGLCSNGGYCLVNYLNQAYCSCPSGYYGQFCQICKIYLKLIIFYVLIFFFDQKIILVTIFHV